MNCNHIVKDGFSNPETERFFTSWDTERAMKTIADNQNCGACQRCLFLAGGTGGLKWLLCLHQDSLYYLQTLSWAFGCPDRIPDPTVQHLILPALDPPACQAITPETTLSSEADESPRSTSLLPSS